ncbi:MAG: hypothetical protein IPO78_09790 [Saprospiraceae bacterium]|nr:hypothetical protein [Saprospiraceae bacterium]MBK9721889.1 hypothetical protein [Saprospiraceae bacterium]
MYTLQFGIAHNSTVNLRAFVFTCLIVLSLFLKKNGFEEITNGFILVPAIPLLFIGLFIKLFVVLNSNWN